MKNLQPVYGQRKAHPEDAGSFPLDGFHRTAARLVLDSEVYDDLNEWEQKFISSMVENAYPTINEKQWTVLGRLVCAAARIERRRAGGQS